MSLLQVFFFFVLKQGTATEAQNIPSVLVAKFSIMPSIFHKHGKPPKKQNAPESTKLLFKWCWILQTVLPFLMWMICVKDVIYSLFLLQLISAVLS